MASDLDETLTMTDEEVLEYAADELKNADIACAGSDSAVCRLIDCVSALIELLSRHIHHVHTAKLPPGLPDELPDELPDGWEPPFRIVHQLPCATHPTEAYYFCPSNTTLQPSPRMESFISFAGSQLKLFQSIVLAMNAMYAKGNP